MLSKSKQTKLPDQDILIRDYLDGDFPAIASLWKATGLGDARRGDHRETIERTIRLGGKLLVMINACTGKLIGTSWMTYDGRRIHLHHFGIHPDYQEKGLANLLLSESVRFARETQTQIKLEVERPNHRAVALYIKHGFRKPGDYDMYILRNP